MMENEEELQKNESEFHWIMRDGVINELEKENNEFQQLQHIAQELRTNLTLIDDLESGSIIWDGKCTKENLETIRLYFSNRASIEYLIGRKLYEKGKKDGVQIYKELTED